MVREYSAAVQAPDKSAYIYICKKPYYVIAGNCERLRGKKLVSVDCARKNFGLMGTAARLENNLQNVQIFHYT